MGLIRRDLSEDHCLRYFAFMLLAILKDNPRYKTLAELSVLLTRECLFDLIWYYQGQTIQIPTKEELEEVIKALLLYYFRDCMGYPINRALDKAQIRSEDLGKFESIVESLKPHLKELDEVVDWKDKFVSTEGSDTSGLVT